MSVYAVYKMFDGCDVPHNVEANGHLIGACVGTCDTDPIVQPRRDGWHTEPPSDDRYVLCQGARGAFFVGAFEQLDPYYGMGFYVPYKKDHRRYAVAWRELPPAYKN